MFRIIHALSSMLLVTSISVHGQAAPLVKYIDEKPQNIPVFQLENVIEVIIQGDFPDVNKKNANQNVPTAAVLTYKDGLKEIKLNVQLEARGGGRSWWCEFTPMKLILYPDTEDKKQKKEYRKALRGTLFENSHPNLKLVTHCKSQDYVPTNQDWDQMVIAEHTLYQILLASGLPALDSQIVRATYLDKEGKRFDEGYLIILESKKDLAQRMKRKDIANDNQVDYRKLLPDANRIQFELGLHLIASADDHEFRTTKNAFILGSYDKVAKAADNVIPTPMPESGLQIAYDFVLNPRNFPYSEFETPPYLMENYKDYLRKYVENNPELKPEIIKTLKTITDNSAEIFRVIDESLLTKDGYQKKNIVAWVQHFLDQAQQIINENKE